jgi:magnesium-transporting ATPase (P-type)
VAVVLQSEQEEEHSSAEGLVCGDVVRVDGAGWTVPADLVLVAGSCAVDESGYVCLLRK